jgi:hypothetical protein
MVLRQVSRSQEQLKSVSVWGEKDWNDFRDGHIPINVKVLFCDLQTCVCVTNFLLLYQKKFDYLWPHNNIRTQRQIFMKLDSGATVMQLAISPSYL